jgi:hypothetical protein
MQNMHDQEVDPCFIGDDYICVQNTSTPIVEQSIRNPREASDELIKLLDGFLGPPAAPPQNAVIAKTYRHDADLAKNKWPIVEVRYQAAILTSESNRYSDHIHFFDQTVSKRSAQNDRPARF